MPENNTASTPRPKRTEPKIISHSVIVKDARKEITIEAIENHRGKAVRVVETFGGGQMADRRSTIIVTAGKEADDLAAAILKANAAHNS